MLYKLKITVISQVGWLVERCDSLNTSSGQSTQDDRVSDVRKIISVKSMAQTAVSLLVMIRLPA